MLLKLDHASESPGELAKPWLTGPHLLTFWLSSSGMGPEKLHIWQVSKWHWWCYCGDDTWRTTALNNLVILSRLYFYHLMGSRRVGHDWAASLSLFTFTHWKRKWQPTPVFLPGESQGWGSLVGCRLWGRTELDRTEATQQQQKRHVRPEMLQSCNDPGLCDSATLWTVACQVPLSRDSPGKNTGVGCSSGATRGLNPYLLVSCEFFTTSATWEAPYHLQSEL